jgi:hypothetical protein
MRAPTTRTRDRKRTAHIQNGEVRPPTVYVHEMEHDETVSAICRALEQCPNEVGDPAVKMGDDGTIFTYIPNELPATEGGELQGWHPPYRAEENLRAALRDELPDGWTLETVRQGRLLLREE